MRNFTEIVCEQRSEAWFKARLGRATASKAGRMLATNKDGKFAASRREYAMQIILERMTGKSQENSFQSRAMEQGIEREESALFAYEALTGNIVTTCGFLAHNTLMAGASLDGYLGDFETLLSIKCRQPAAHWDFLRTGKVPGDALHQMRCELWLTGAKQHVYFSWNPDFPTEPRDMQSGLHVFTASEMDIPGFDAAIRKFLEEVDLELGSVQGWQAVTA